MQVLGAFAAYHAGSFASGLQFHVLFLPEFDVVVQLHFGGSKLTFLSLSVVAGSGPTSGAALSSSYLSLESLSAVASIVTSAVQTGVSWQMTGVSWWLSHVKFPPSSIQVPPDVSAPRLRVHAVWSEVLYAVPHQKFVRLKLPGPSSPLPSDFSVSCLRVDFVWIAVLDVAVQWCYGGLKFSFPCPSVAPVIV